MTIKYKAFYKSDYYNYKFSNIPIIDPMLDKTSEICFSWSLDDLFFSKCYLKNNELILEGWHCIMGPDLYSNMEVYASQSVMKILEKNSDFKRAFILYYESNSNNYFFDRVIKQNKLPDNIIKLLKFY